MSSKKPYGANNWRLIKNAPEELFSTPTFEEFMDERMHSWELRDSYVSVNRVYNTKTGKVTEKAYQQQGAATKYLANLLTNEDLDIATATHSELYHFKSNELND